MLHFKVFIVEINDYVLQLSLHLADLSLESIELGVNVDLVA